MVAFKRAFSSMGERFERRVELGFQLELHGPRGQKAELLEVNV